MSNKKVPILEEFEWQQSVIDKDLTAPPGSPAKGDRYIIPTGGSGVWADNIHDIALCIVGGGSPSWEFADCVEGMICWVKDEDLYYRYDGSAWGVFPTPNIDTKLDEGGTDEVSAHEIVTNIYNTLLNAFRIAINGSLSIFKMIDGFVDEFEDETGVDTSTSTNEDYDSVNDLYQPLVVALLEIDYMEYATDILARAAYVSSDGLDAYTSLLLHCNGDNDSTSIIDESGKIATVNGNTKLKTATKKFGTASVYFEDTGNDYISFPTSSDFDISSGDWTIDFWAKTSRSGDSHIMGNGDNPSPSEAWYVKINGGVLYMCGVNGSSEWNTGISGSADDAWHHIAIVRSGDVLYAWKDGDSRASTACTSMSYIAEELRIGRVSASYYFYGYADEIRISKGIARWTDTTFSVPTSEYSSNLLDYSEGTIKTQGSYSLKAMAVITNSLNDTLTRTIGSPIDLSGLGTIKFDIRSSRTGSNIKIGIHDSGGTTSEITPNITEADAFQTVTWDISGIADANKDDIDSIIITVVNADAANIFYIDNMLYPGVTNNMTLISNAITAEVEPDNARAVIFEEDVDSITINTDLKFYITRDGGTTYTQLTLVDEGDYASGKRILVGNIDISGQPSGTTMKYKLESLNNKNLKIHGVAELWN